MTYSPIFTLVIEMFHENERQKLQRHMRFCFLAVCQFLALGVVPCWSLQATNRKWDILIEILQNLLSFGKWFCWLFWYCNLSVKRHYNTGENLIVLFQDSVSIWECFWDTHVCVYVAIVDQSPGVSLFKRPLQKKNKGKCSKTVKAGGKFWQ